jgi:hypothetical protein
MNRWVGFVLLFSSLLTPAATAGIFSKSNTGPKINYKKRYVAKPYNKNQKHSTPVYGLPKGKRAPK